MFKLRINWQVEQFLKKQQGKYKTVLVYTSSIVLAGATYSWLNDAQW